MLHAAHPVGEGVHGAHGLPLRGPEDRRDLHVDLLRAQGLHASADADGEPLQLGRRRQAHAGTLVHQERDLLDLRRMRDLVPDDVADGGLQDVHEVAPALRGHLHLEERPGAVQLELHQGDDVRASVVAPLELELLHWPALLQQDDLAVVDVVQTPPLVVHRDDEDHELYLRLELLQGQVDLLVVAVPFSGRGVTDQSDGAL
mmetsp:Transcript_42916/g.127213  ORF Transcript_42916/g.127213 Transcript_42916/m.127213 type:complete len:202 (+) Transcript_42916:1008-1613(+)